MPYKGPLAACSTSWSAACARAWATAAPPPSPSSRSGPASCASPAAGLRESHPHDVTITTEAPNYWTVTRACGRCGTQAGDPMFEYAGSLLLLKPSEARRAQVGPCSRGICCDVAGGPSDVDRWCSVPAFLGRRRGCLHDGHQRHRSGRRVGVARRIDPFPGGVRSCPVAEVEIGMGKAGRRAYGLDDVAHRAQPAHPRPRGRRPGVGDRRVPLRPADHGVGHGRRGQPGHGHRHRRAGRRRRPATSRACGPATRTPSRCSTRSPRCPTTRPRPALQELYAEPIKPELIAARIKEVRAAGVVVVARRSRPSGCRRSPTRSLAAELDLLVIQGTVVSAEHVTKRRRAAQPQDVRAPLRHPGDRRRLRQLPGRAAPDAHGRRRRPGRRRCRASRRPPAGCSASAWPRPPPSPTPGPPGCATSTRPASTSTSSPTAAWPPVATSPRPSPAAPTR